MQILQHVPAVPVPAVRRHRLMLHGAVQGVGFRPFVFRLATELNLTGWVRNSPAGVVLEVEGPPDDLERFRECLAREKPAPAFIQGMEILRLDPAGYRKFEILPSEEKGAKTSVVLPDLATCPDCLGEIMDPANRRYLYPFTNCTHCGPRYSIMLDIPYDRANTTMNQFVMCPACRAEYEDSRDRRFHAQPNACAACGPQLAFWDTRGRAIARQHEALIQAAEAIADGRIVAVKGLGGFHLLVRAQSEEAVWRLRERKQRELKPLALMYPHLDLVKQDCEVSDAEERLLRSAAAPIVLLHRKARSSVADAVAPRNPCLGVMLPYSPLHHLLLQRLEFPVVATSANLSDEPICADEREAVQRLKGIADFYLVHNRPIARPIDDSVMRILADREMVLRRARGIAPLPIYLAHPVSPTLAVGGHLKNTVALASGHQVFISQHLGDLDSVPSRQVHTQAREDLQRLYDTYPTRLAADKHPDYFSTRSARETGAEIVEIQHHHAHIVSCMAENDLDGSVLGVAWDGSGYGEDQTVWGGEFLRADPGTFERAGHWRTFRLPGGERAVREPRRAALGLLYELFGAEALERREAAPVLSFSTAERRTLRAMLIQKLNSPVTSSAGRLFDGVASLLGLCQVASFEGQAAMELEFALHGVETEESYPLSLIQRRESGWPIHLDWGPMIREILSDFRRDIPAGLISARFHNTLAESIVAMAHRIGEERVVLSGGCFQNRYLTERVIRRLRDEQFKPYWHQRVPPNDGGLALGQAVVAATRNMNALAASPIDHKPLTIYHSLCA